MLLDTFAPSRTFNYQTCALFNKFLVVLDEEFFALVIELVIRGILAHELLQLLIEFLLDALLGRKQLLIKDILEHVEDVLCKFGLDFLVNALLVVIGFFVVMFDSLFKEGHAFLSEILCFFTFAFSLEFLKVFFDEFAGLFLDFSASIISYDFPLIW